MHYNILTYTRPIPYNIYLCTGDGCSMIVFMIRGMNSATSACTLGLYSWYIRTTMMGSSARTFSDRTPRGMMLYWNSKGHTYNYRTWLETRLEPLVIGLREVWLYWNSKGHTYNYRTWLEARLETLVIGHREVWCYTETVKAIHIITGHDWKLG